MSQDAVIQSGSTRQLALARRKAMSVAGKAAISGGNGNATSASAVESRHTAASPPRAADSAAPAGAAGSARAASLARRKALSRNGKSADSSRDRTRTGAVKSPANATTAATVSEEKSGSGKGCGCGCGGVNKNTTEKTASTVESADSTTQAALRSRRQKPVRCAAIPASTARAVSLARRKALSTRGKAAINTGAMTEAQAVRATNPKLTGRELARVLREQRSRRGGAGQKNSVARGRRRKASDKPVGAAQDAPWKVGASETSSGQTVTGTMVGRKENITGDEASTCRPITGTEYMGAEIFNSFCQTGTGASSLPRPAEKVTVTSTSHGNRVTGDRTGRSAKVTGNEPGTCKHITGDEYVSAELVQSFCAETVQKSPPKISMAETMKGKMVTGNNVGRSERVTGDEYGMRKSLTGTQYAKPEDTGFAPSKVGTSTTLRGGRVTGTVLGHREKMTGDEAGSCRSISGDEYIGQEQYSKFCDSTPQPQDRKVAVSQTLGGGVVTGSLTGRSGTVTGDEPGTCKAITGTPYAGREQYSEYCEPEAETQAELRMRPAARTWAKPLTGQQPGVGGKLTGADKGACETVSGTPYMGVDQAAEVCPTIPAEPGSSDFPQALAQSTGGQAPWEDFSVKTSAHASQKRTQSVSVTGSQQQSGHITGPFGMAEGKVTGTEEMRFGSKAAQYSPRDTVPMEAETVDGRMKTRISGEGMDAGLRITGDNWDRGNHVTGTEGLSATRRNPTLRSRDAMNPMPAAGMARPEGQPLPVSKVTGSSGNAEGGSLITYSGGARG